MKIKIVTTKSFNSLFIKLAKKRPQIISLLFTALALLHIDQQAPSLRIHKLSGQLKNRWAFWLTYDLRVIFERKKGMIILLDIGNHDEVY